MTYEEVVSVVNEVLEENKAEIRKWEKVQRKHVSSLVGAVLKHEKLANPAVVKEIIMNRVARGVQVIRT